MVYKPSTNGRAEAAVCLLLGHLGKVVLHGRLNWWRAVLPAVFCLNAKPGAGGFSPHLLVFGRYLKGFGDGHPGPAVAKAADIYEYVTRLDQHTVQSACLLECRHKQRAQHYNVKHEQQGHADGDPVWVRAVGADASGKLDPYWTGPHKVIRREGSLYWVNKGQGEVQCLAQDLQPFIAPCGFGDRGFCLHFYVDRPVPNDAIESYAVEKIVGDRRGSKEPQCNVKWGGPDKLSWEPPSSFLDNLNQLLVDYVDKKKAPHSLRDFTVPFGSVNPSIFWPPSTRLCFRLPLRVHS